MLLSSLYEGSCSLAVIWRGGLWGHAQDGWRHPSPRGAAAVFFRNVMQQLAFLPTGTAAACGERLPALVLPAGFSSLMGAFPAL